MKITYANKKVEKYFSDYTMLQKKLPFEWVRTIKNYIEVEGVCDYHGSKENWYIP